MCCLMFLGAFRANRREPKSCLSLVFHSKLVSFCIAKEVHAENERPCLKLKTRHRFQPDTLSLSMIYWKVSWLTRHGQMG